jgi:restriction system protein
LLDLLSDELACRSGILLTIRELREVAVHVPSEALRNVLLGDLNRVVTRASDIYSDLVLELRFAIGNLPDNESALARRMRVWPELAASGHDPSHIMSVFVQVGMERADRCLGEEAVMEVQRRTGAPLEVVNGVLLLIADGLDRDATPFGLRASHSWDGVVPLASLFGGEHIPADAEAYVDQRFLDFLAARSERLDEMHWRNFERLCAEFFKRAGFVVHLGPGSDDGGVDVRVWNPDNRETPFLLVQCKRFAEGKLVKVETVKALWADVEYEGAQQGLIATTAHVTPGGKREADARGYRMGFVESRRVREWARSMWRFSYDAPHRKMIPGTPLE